MPALALRIASSLSPQRLKDLADENRSGGALNCPGRITLDSRVPSALYWLQIQMAYHNIAAPQRTIEQPIAVFILRSGRTSIAEYAELLDTYYRYR
jgi:hypothetical protein